MSSQAYVHLVKKAAIAEHVALPVDASLLPALEDGHIRVRSAVVAITYNNLTYARMGSIRQWWDAFPVPEQLPAPYNDCSQYGIAPCWGYGEILESRVSGLEAGMMLYGYWPISDLPVDFKLVPGDVSSHWFEVSEQRKTLMPFYNRYMVRDPRMRLADLDQARLNSMAAEAVWAVWECGYLLNKYNLSEPYVHPAGHEGPPDPPWSKEKGDLISAVVINLSAGGRTARSFIDGLVRDREPATGPLGLLNITGSPESDLAAGASFPSRTISYQATTEPETVAWIAGLKPKKIVLCDFGGRGASLFDLVDTLKKQLPSVDVVIVGIGVDAKPWTLEETMGQMKKRIALPNRFQMNTGPIRDSLTEQMGPQAYFSQVKEAWEAFVARGNLEATKMIWGEGVEGEKGLEGGWDTICKGELASDAALVYRL